MEDDSLDLIAVLQNALPGLDDQFDLFELTAGTLIANATQNYTLVYPAYYLTNITSDYPLTVDALLANLTGLNFGGVEDLLNKEPFVGGVVAISFVLCGIVTAGWMFFLLLMLSSHSIPNSLILTNLFFCAGHSAMLTKLTQILQSQVQQNFADTTSILSLITNASNIIVVRSVTSLLIWISWVDLLVQINKYNKRRFILVCGITLSLVSFAFSLAYGFVSRDMQPTGRFKGVKVVNYFLEYLMITLYAYQMIVYSFKKRKFAYHRKALALTIFAICTLMTPYAFNTIDMVSGYLRSWSTYVLAFTKLCITVVTWEWLHTIRSLQLKYEKKAVLGRQISNENFAQITGMDPGELHPSGNSYILKSINIAGLLGYLNPGKWANSLYRMAFKDYSTVKAEEDVERISLQSMDENLSRRQSNISQETGISIVADHPRFDVDHRYLRNTPSTLHSRNTPISYTNATPDIPEDISRACTPPNDQRHD